MFPFRPRFVGIDSSPGSWRMAIVRMGKSTWKVEALREFSSQAELEMAVKKNYLTTALPTKEVLVRSLDLPLKKKKELKAALEFQIEPRLPYPMDQAVVQYITTETHSLGSRITVLSARKDHIQNHLAGHTLSPDFVTAIPLALAALTKILPKSNDPLLIMHASETEGTCVLVQEGKLLVARSFDMEKYEIQKAVLAIVSSHKSKKIDSILLLSEERKLADFVEEATGKSVFLPENTIAQTNICKFALAIGCALATTSDDCPNFRQNAYPTPRQWKRVRKPLMAFLVFAAALFGTVLGLEQTLLRNQENHLYQKAHSLASLVGEEGQLPQSKEKLLGHLQKLKQKIDTQPDTFPLLPGTPKVSDLIAWFSTHPQIIGENGEVNISIEKLNYTMTKRPDLTQKKQPYQVRVDLEFVAASPSAARAFHDALLASNPMVDTQKEVEWTSSTKTYKASFFLKDKTRYIGP